MKPSDHVRKLLIVDDDTGVAEAFRQYIGKALGEGWSITVEHTVAGALERLLGGGFDVCLTDYMLDADMTALDLVERAVDVAPELRGRFIVCTGLFLDPEHEIFSELGCRRLDKPFAIDDLLAVVAETVGG